MWVILRQLASLLVYHHIITLSWPYITVGISQYYNIVLAFITRKALVRNSQRPQAKAHMTTPTQATGTAHPVLITRAPHSATGNASSA
jgi:hypothetical protein